MKDEKKSSLDQSEVLDLMAKREEFMETFFHKGAEFSAELIEELQELRQSAAKLAEENMELRHQLASDDAIRDLLRKIEKLEREKESLLSRMEIAVHQSRDFAGRYAEVEKELDAMANLFVAAYQLHANLDINEVLGVIEQLLLQLVGVHSFAIYLRKDGDDDKMLEPVHAYHCDKVKGAPVALGEGPIGEAAVTQVPFVVDPKTCAPGEPLACIPMVLRDLTIGVIAVFGLLQQKDNFVELDFKLFKLLALHSASAIVAAGLLKALNQDVGAGLKAYERL